MRTLAIVLFSLVPTIAQAHIHLTSPLSRTDNTQGDPQKTEHCGGTPGRIEARAQAFPPGATITVTWAETINHPGWFRIAFQPNGEVFGIPPASNGPTGGGQASNYPTENQEGVDAINGSIVLKDRIPDGMTSAEITLPNIECTTCTLQFIQVMIDKPPYTIDALSDDIYFNCADITLSTAAPPPNPTPDAGVGTPDAGGGTGTTTGGCASTSGGHWGMALVLLALARRRRHR